MKHTTILAVVLCACGPLPAEEDSVARNSIFRDRTQRGGLQTQPSMQSAKQVTTADELAAAVAVDVGEDAQYGLQGRRIVITAAITLIAPIRISRPGVIIESDGFLPISITSGMASAFNVDDGYQIEFRSLNFPALNGATPSSAWIVAGTETRVVGCHTANGGVLVRIDGVSQVVVSENFILGGGSSVVVVDGENNVVSGNIFDGSITASGTATRNVITGNSGVAGVGVITTNTSAGLNTIQGNTGVTVTPHGTDNVAGGNTA